ncbi:hypothetical protein BOW53_03300 [Solemya pervernicosa gill symbiont]|uniref:DUF1269 domain-containing protein n=1 Tax=Solemya pervernicosa gill symbiont TaxID=642797 RepID=A0A1T2L8X0_9GAMM|nr:hypothetical protein [Solemya pervernicosa gill symbiont]OOZ41549.1 hypothetical protein BOW53_03300 [Solemya pervernicosa gill symbiont]
MKRRLYLLFPDAEFARRGVAALNQDGIETRRIHTIARNGESLEGLPGSTFEQRSDRLHQLERWVWNGNLTLFFIMLAGFFVAISYGAVVVATLLVVAMLVSFLAGERFTHLPDADFREVRDALAHGEIMLMVDIPESEVYRIEHQIHQQVPEARFGGVSWLPDTAAQL